MAELVMMVGLFAGRVVIVVHQTSQSLAVRLAGSDVGQSTSSQSESILVVIGIWSKLLCATIAVVGVADLFVFFCFQFALH
jgi:hypothetical protein